MWFWFQLLFFIFIFFGCVSCLASASAVFQTPLPATAMEPAPSLALALDPPESVSLADLVDGYVWATINTDAPVLVRAKTRPSVYPGAAV